MKLRFTPRALENIFEIAGYIRARNPAAARRVRIEIYDTLKNLILFPMPAIVKRPRACVRISSDCDIVNL
jgi:plasmid stabilization system protein ParE